MHLVKRFQFRLEPLLKYRKIIKEQAQLELAKAVDEMRREQCRLVDIKAQLAEAMTLLRQRQGKTIFIDELASFHYFFDNKRNDIRVQQEKIAQIAQKRNECRKALEQAAKNCEIVEKLKGKCLLQFRTAMLHEEQKFLDEIGTQNFVRRK